MREIKKPKYNISDYDRDVFEKIQDGKYQERQFIKIYDSLFNIEDFTVTTILVYSVIRNQIYVTALHNGNDANVNLVGLSTFISNETFSHYGIIPRSLYRSLDTLKEYGFISASTGTNRKNGRIITLLRDVKEYQPEELKLLKGNDIQNIQDIQIDNKSTKVKTKSKVNSKNKNNKDNKKEKTNIDSEKVNIQNQNQNQNNQNTESTESLGEELDDFEF